MTIDFQKLFDRWFGPISLLIAALIFLSACQIYYDVSSSETWPQKQAEVLYSEQGKFCRNSCYYNPKVTYRYQHGGQNFTSDRVFFGSSITYDRTLVEQKLVRPVGSMVLIHFNPADPGEAVMVAGTVGHGTWSRSISFFFMACFLASLPRLRRITAPLRAAIKAEAARKAALKAE